LGSSFDILVDALGQSCPVPVIRTADAVRALPPGGSVLVISDDPAIEFDLPAWGRSTGHDVILVARGEREFRYRVERSDDP
jgi:TusA-related sulfurtransferase